MLNQPRLQRIFCPNTDVHVFWRDDNRRSFAYTGRGLADEVKDTSPLDIVWRFD